MQTSHDKVQTSVTTAYKHTWDPSHQRVAKVNVADVVGIGAATAPCPVLDFPPSHPLAVPPPPLLPLLFLLVVSCDAVRQELEKPLAVPAAVFTVFRESRDGTGPVTQKVFIVPLPLTSMAPLGTSVSSGACVCTHVLDLMLCAVP